MIHPTALIDPAAELAEDVQVGPFTVIGPDVKIGAGTVIESHVVIKGPTTIGKNNRIFQFASVGEECQDKKYKGEPTRLEIGDDNVIRESVTIHRGTIQDNSLTKIGSRNLLMAYVHVAHDCIVGNDCIFANNASIAGHAQVGNGVILGGMTGVHQFCKIGSYAMTSGCSFVIKDIPAYVMVSGNPAHARSMNFEGMKRRGWSKETIASLRTAYKVLYRQGLTQEQAIAEMEAMEASPELQILIDSLKASERGITR
ncbi:MULTISPECIES: acyl-ACP--UDP-N-acetylglucosamine O-acyltransferase [unclassified Alcanivorax]|jgi:UDP-N-acetylglucosamine acyltransferase|uniref:acyl-ACP--UDP-N-acetylglucosamine O-acyltransferase n=1 Tax=unclassified Alcanivorax TaxID=2638842 RepID=UPI0008A04197|nr:MULTISPECIES: acyl-ACP--UDP-N-acetylglucosamine O-acyltransferase [unclassified Alcanivorax]MBB10741.1 acyl-[acyl-carrier-protein]--UDP-N-acetylglucosamine O-acyltransferase [Alcanivorax sp.]MBU83717.1 acyl-[acyl-carrier-protein]--UDP-N-acetylglucosamine O-acyltransferase [Alcanivorax sp.]MEE3388259.1 acyl-ACP--UDP-N-acetylglucosamine O-acyltransferase [Pseudomonadota bacterium]SEF58025.1 acyl-[acyl-carrier-protein]--UDP-N-acetylglucosamine O-acyltransferase [Alcanivorax sp. DSM 26293]